MPTVLRKSHHEHVFDLDPDSTDLWGTPLTLRLLSRMSLALRSWQGYVHVHVSLGVIEPFSFCTAEQTGFSEAALR